MSWPDEVMEDWDPKDRLRFRLIEIAFEKTLASMANKDEDIPAGPVGVAVVEYADAVLAAMDATPDTGPSVLLAIRAKLQDYRTLDQHVHEKLPTTSERVLGYREGTDTATAMAVRFIDEAMEATREAENDEQKGTT